MAAPKGLPVSIQTRLVRHAKEIGVDPNLVLTRYATERILYRLSRSNKQHERLSQLADAKGLSISRLLAGLVERELAENPEERVQRLIAQAQDDRAPAEKYTVRLMGIDAARLEARAQGRSVTPSGYVAQLLRAHLRANPPMPYKEFEELRRVVNELAGIRGALTQLARIAHRESKSSSRCEKTFCDCCRHSNRSPTRCKTPWSRTRAPGRHPMPKRRPVRVTRDQPGGINPGSYGRKAPPMSHSTERWTSRMGSVKPTRVSST